MSHQFKNQQLRRRRLAKGQALLSGTMMIALVVAIVVPLLALLLNLQILGNQHDSMQKLAGEAASQIAAQRWWLGMERKDFKPEEATQKAFAALNCELAELGYPRARNFTVQFDQATAGVNEIGIVQVGFDVNGLPLAGAGILPSVTTLHVNGVSSDSEHSITRHGQILIHVCGPDGQERGVRIPCYNATNGNGSAVSGGPTTGNSVGQDPHGYMQILCKNSGS